MTATLIKGTEIREQILAETEAARASAASPDALRALVRERKK